jgi:hypothetical protein
VELVCLAKLGPLRIAQTVERQDVDFEQSQSLHKSRNGFDVFISIVVIFDHRETQNKPAWPVRACQGFDILMDQLIVNPGFFAVTLRVHMLDIDKGEINHIH